ncbi:MAG TPA: cytochrome c [Candidatus Limnocylindria bacterium]|jgi:polar amino acid transport system substrate-binding protein|nr:cytochrome c [Candidatus Limnocylindria bacterium]
MSHARLAGLAGALLLGAGLWAAAFPTPTRAAVAAPAGPPQLYTSAQATAGKAVYDASCTSCHGAQLQGVSAPPLVGSGFSGSPLTLGQFHQTVTTEMPFDNPGSLTPEQYADVIAYLLAANCYPAGASPYPVGGDKAHADLKVTTQGNGQLCIPK